MSIQNDASPTTSFHGLARPAAHYPSTMKVRKREIFRARHAAPAQSRAIQGHLPGAEDVD